MARQIGDIKITGTIDDVTFYRMGGEYYARMKSSLTAKKVKTHPNFGMTRMYAKWLGEASKLASEVYRSLPLGERKYTVYCRLKTIAHKLVKEGVVREAILPELRKHMEEMMAKPVKKAVVMVRKTVVRVIRVTGRITTKGRRNEGAQGSEREPDRRKWTNRRERRRRGKLQAIASGP